MPLLSLGEKEHLVFHVTNCRSTRSEPVIIHRYGGRVNDTDESAFGLKDFETLLDFEPDCAQVAGVIGLDIARRTIIVHERAYERISPISDGKIASLSGLRDTGYSVEQEFSLDYELPDKLYETLQHVLNSPEHTSAKWPHTTSRFDKSA